MRNLSTLSNVKTLSNKSASKIKGGEKTIVLIDSLTKEIVLIDNMTTNTTSCNTYKVTIK